LAQAGNHLLTELVMEIKSGNLRRCEALGLTDNEIRLLNSLTIEDLHYLSQSPVSIITCQIHRENLRLLLTRAKEVHRQNQMIERCLRLG
ncbi:STY4526/YPO1902 family pathogenicity island replication protein, partial [Vibrio cholerae]